MGIKYASSSNKEGSTSSQKEVKAIKFGSSYLENMTLEDFKNIPLGKITEEDIYLGTNQRLYFDDVCESEKDCNTTAKFLINNKSYSILIEIDVAELTVKLSSDGVFRCYK